MKTPGINGRIESNIKWIYKRKNRRLVIVLWRRGWFTALWFRKTVNLYSCFYHSEDDHMSGRNMSVVTM